VRVQPVSKEKSRSRQHSYRYGCVNENPWCALSNGEFAGGAEKIKGFGMKGMLNPFTFSGAGSLRNPILSHQDPTDA
jgi:hypothetical protein